MPQGLYGPGGWDQVAGASRLSCFGSADLSLRSVVQVWSTSLAEHDKAGTGQQLDASSKAAILHCVYAVLHDPATARPRSRT